MVHPWVGRSQDLRLGALTGQVSPDLVDAAVDACGRREAGPRALPARAMVYFVLAGALFHQDSYEDVAENLVAAIPGMDRDIPNKSSFTRARQQLGPEVLQEVFRAVAGPVAAPGLSGSFWRGWRLAAVDGFYLEVPDAPANRARFGGPRRADGTLEGFPQARVVTMSECGTHAVIDARVGGRFDGEPELAVQMADSAAGMMVIIDRGFPGVQLWRAYTGARAHLLIRAKKNIATTPVRVLADGTYLARMSGGGYVKGVGFDTVTVRVVEYQVDGGETIRLLTDLLDPEQAPAGELAELYHQRWEAELSNRQIETYQRGPGEVLRSADPALVVQEVYAHLTVHHCLTRIIADLADDHDIDPDRISFTKILKAVRRSVIQGNTDTPRTIKRFLTALARKLPKLLTGPRRDREADRQVKRLNNKYGRPPTGWRRQPVRRIQPKHVTLLPQPFH